MTYSWASDLSTGPNFLCEVVLLPLFYLNHSIIQLEGEQVLEPNSDFSTVASWKLGFEISFSNGNNKTSFIRVKGNLM